MRTRSETVMKKFLSFQPSRCRFAAVEPFGVDDAVLFGIIEGLVEGLHLGIVTPHQELHLRDALSAQPVLRGRHHGPAKTAAAMIRIDADVIDPAAMAVVAGH